MRQSMVLSGLTFPRFVSSAVLTFFLPFFMACLRAQSGEIAGTMPEDYLPELKTILATAMQRSPQLLAAEFERAVQEARILVADSVRLPNLRGASEFNSNQTSVSSNNGSSSRASGVFYRFEAGQAIFHWDALKNQSEAARINLLVAEKNFALVYRELAVVLRKSYLALVIENAKLRQGREALRLLRNDIASATDKQERGQISPASVEGDKLRAREVALELNRGEAEFAASRRRFARIAGLDDLAEEAIPGEIPAPIFSPPLAAAMTATLLRDGGKSTLEYEIYDLKVREAILRHKIEKTRLLPKINAGAAFSLENSTNVNGATVNQEAFQRQAVSVSAQWNIFDGFATRGVIREALAARRLNEKKLANETAAILQNAQLLEQSLKLDAEALEIGEIRRLLAVETKKRIVEEAGLGNLPKGDVDRAQIGILQADAAIFASRATFLGHWSEFVSLAGHDPVLNNVPLRHVREKK
ncbi:MAG: TolC family protein [Opitutus sp.]|nr:TolC family protein [Opitutus sp.]